MNNEIKEILDNVRKCCDITKDQSFVVYQRQDILKLLDCITNLQEQLHQASLDIQELTERDIECPSWCDKLTNLQQENERLKVKYNEEKSHQINYNYFETLYSKSTKEIVIDDLVWKCEELDNFKKEYEKSYIEKEDYKSRIEKAVEIAKDLKQFVYDELVDRNVSGATETHDKIINLLNILNGRSDE